MKDFILELEKIAAHLNDRWNYNINIDVRGKNIKFTFQVEEKADRHTILSESGNTIEEAIANARKNLMQSIKHFYNGFPELETL